MSDPVIRGGSAATGRRLQDLMQWRGDLFMAGRYAELAEQYVFPMTLHVDGTTIMVPEAATMVSMFESWRADWRARGVARAQVAVTGADTPRLGRFRLWTTVQEIGATGHLLGQKNYVQHSRMTSTGIRTEVMEVIRNSAAQMWPQDQAPGIAD